MFDQLGSYVLRGPGHVVRVISELHWCHVSGFKILLKCITLARPEKAVITQRARSVSYWLRQPARRSKVWLSSALS